MKVISALKNFELLTGKPLTILNNEIQDYGIMVQEIRDGKIEPSQFLMTELADILTKDFHITIDTLDEGAEWDFLYRMMQESRSFQKYCLETHRNEMIQMNELDNETLGRILSMLRLSQSNTVVDVGCRNGYLTEFISDHTQARIIGIDMSSYAIHLALERTKGKQDRLTFRVGDINEIRTVLRDYPGIDTIIAIEVLYTSRNLHETIRDFNAILQGNGQMLFIANQHIDQHEVQADKLLPDQTDIATTIQQHGLPMQILDITPQKLYYLERSITLLERYKHAFEQEGNRDFWAARIIYDKKMLKRVQEGLTRRFMYYVKPLH